MQYAKLINISIIVKGHLIINRESTLASIPNMNMHPLCYEHNDIDFNCYVVETKSCLTVFERSNLPTCM